MQETKHTDGTSAFVRRAFIFSHTESMNRPLVSLPSRLPASPASVSGLFLHSPPPLPSFSLSISLQSWERREEYKRVDEEESPSSWGPVPVATAAETIHPTAGRQRWHRFGIQPWCKLCGSAFLDKNPWGLWVLWHSELTVTTEVTPVCAL